MKKLFCIFVIVLLFLFTGCSNSEIDELRNNMSFQNKQVDAKVDLYEKNMICYEKINNTIETYLFKDDMKFPTFDGNEDCFLDYMSACNVLDTIHQKTIKTIQKYEFDKQDSITSLKAYPFFDKEDGSIVALYNYTISHNPVQVEVLIQNGVVVSVSYDFPKF